jgi:hypothetical protein
VLACAIGLLPDKEETPATPQATKEAQAIKEAEARIAKELDKQTSIEFIKTPLKDVVAYIEDLHGIQAKLDTKSLKGSGVSDETAITAEIKGVTLRMALDALLGGLKLTYEIRNGKLVISAPRAEKKPSKDMP